MRTGTRVSILVVAIAVVGIVVSSTLSSRRSPSKTSTELATSTAASPLGSFTTSNSRAFARVEREASVESSDSPGGSGEDVYTPVANEAPVPTPVSNEPSSRADHRVDVNEAASEDSKTFWIWLGVGVNSTGYSQTIPGASAAKYSNIKAPALLLRAGSRPLRRVGIDVSYKETPGGVKSSGTIEVRDGAYTWKTFGAEGLFSALLPSRGLDLRLDLRGGFQHHMVPFMVPVDFNEIELRENQFTMATLGLEMAYRTHRRIRYEAMMRYQHPVTSASADGHRFAIRPRFAFDGSVGQVFEFADSWSIGAFWYGQWHDYGFDYHDAKTSTTFSGSQTLFYSTFDLRIGFEF